MKRQLTKVRQVLFTDTIKEALAEYRQQWQETAEQPLVDAQASVGLILCDIARILGDCGMDDAADWIGEIGEMPQFKTTE